MHAGIYQHNSKLFFIKNHRFFQGIIPGGYHERGIFLVAHYSTISRSQLKKSEVFSLIR